MHTNKIKTILTLLEMQNSHTHSAQNTPLYHHTHRHGTQPMRGLITLIKSDITNINIPKTINTQNTELQLVKIHINKTKHITIANTYFPPRDTTSSHYNTVYTDISHCIRLVTNIPDALLKGDGNAHSGTHALTTIEVR